MLTRVEGANESLLTIFILHEALALALCNDVEVISGLSLLNLDLLRLTHHELNLCDHVVLHFRVQSENQVLLELLAEDEPRYLLLERRADHFKEITQLILLIKRLLNVLQVGDNTILNRLW